MKNLFKILLFAVIMLTASIAKAQKTYVVSVGLTNYKYPEVCPPVNCCTYDADAMAHFFHNYNNSKVFLLLNKNATRSHILKVLKSQFAKSTEQDQIIFVFCGHGLQGGLTYYESRRSNDIITYDEIQEIMRSVKARRKIILAMACYSGGLNSSGNGGGRQQARRTVKKTDVMLFTSSRADEPSWANGNMKNSYFISRILNAFQGKGDLNGDGRVTARELFNYVSPNVIRDTEGRQHPQMWGNFDDNMVLVNVR